MSSILSNICWSVSSEPTHSPQMIQSSLLIDTFTVVLRTLKVSSTVLVFVSQYFSQFGQNLVIFHISGFRFKMFTIFSPWGQARNSILAGAFYDKVSWTFFAITLTALTLFTTCHSNIPILMISPIMRSEISIKI